MLKIISANALTDGLVVYFVTAGCWTHEIAQARTFASDAELEAGMGLAKADEKRNLIVDSTAVEVTPAAGGKSLEAVSLRNAIRAKGPTVDFMPRTAS